MLNNIHVINYNLQCDTFLVSPYLSSPFTLVNFHLGKSARRLKKSVHFIAPLISFCDEIKMIISTFRHL